jgi:hypothetical protein
MEKSLNKYLPFDYNFQNMVSSFADDTVEKSERTTPGMNDLNWNIVVQAFGRQKNPHIDEENPTT